MVIGNNTLTVTANTVTFPDNWYGHAKSLVIFYQHKGHDEVRVVFVPQYGTVNISPSDSPGFSHPMPSNGELRLFGAVYGLGDVTTDVYKKIEGGDSLHITASFNPDTWPGNVKTFVGLFQFGNDGIPVMIIQIQDSYISLSAQ